MDAAIAELASVGYSDFRMDKVASRARVNKTTIYRRWPTRRELVSAVVDQLKTSLRENPLPNTGQIERDLIEVFTRRFTFGRKREGQAWARLLNERHSAEVEAIIKDTVDERRNEWWLIVTRAIARGEIPPETNTQLLFDFIRAIVDARKLSQTMDESLLMIAVRTILAGARAGTLA
jgi:AcrR family transcriptional regulator